jgi:hypothetical protein
LADATLLLLGLAGVAYVAYTLIRQASQIRTLRRQVAEYQSLWTEAATKGFRDGLNANAAAAARRVSEEQAPDVETGPRDQGRESS